MTAHSTLGASSAYRWMACPGSVQLIGRAPAGPPSAYAAEGTAAHTLAEQCLLGGHDAEEFIGRMIDDFEVNEDMATAVQVYLNIVRSLEFMAGSTVREVEVSIDLRSLHPDLWGTGDLVLYTASSKTLHVPDYKHGKGVPVEVAGNPQLRYYALGAYMALKDKWPIEKVMIGVVQPRAPHRDGPVRWEEVTPTELVLFGEELVRAARATEAPDAPLKAGDHCRFCSAQAVCPALRDRSLSVAQDEFGSSPAVEQLTADQLGTILTRIDMLDSWVRAVEEHALARLRAGERIPGWKLVDKRATRKWKEDRVIAPELAKLGLVAEQIWVTELRSPAAVEKFLPAPRRKELVPLIDKVSSGTTIAPESDKRPAVQSGPVLDFAPANTVEQTSPVADLFGN